MPSWLVRYLNTKDLRTHFWRALLFGLLMRACCAFFVYGPQALDDYKHGVYPAYQFFAGLPLLDYPDYRSHLLVWFLSFFANVASWFGVESALGQVRAMYFGLGATSLLGLVGTYFYARTQISQLSARLMLYLIALYPLMPFVSTRAFGEAVALSFVLLGFGVLEFVRQQHSRSVVGWLLGFLSLGVATLFRFQVGLLYVAYIGVLIFLKHWRGVLSALGAGLVTVFLQGAIDFMSAKAPLSTLMIYLTENEGGGAKYGVSPWYTTWLFVLAVAFIPFSIPLLRYFRQVWRQQWPVLVCWLVFVLIHSLVAHKEERFLYPILGLEIWTLAALWAQAVNDTWSQKLFSRVFLGLGTVILLVSCFVNSQEGEIEPPAYVESHYKNVIYLDNQSLFGESRFQFYFLRPPSVLKSVESQDFNLHRIDEEMESEQHPQAVVLLTSKEDSREQLRALEQVQGLSSACKSLRRAGSVIDRLLFRLNPKHNQRRRPTWYLICERRS